MNPKQSVLGLAFAQVCANKFLTSLIIHSWIHPYDEG